VWSVAGPCDNTAGYQVSLCATCNLHIRSECYCDVLRIHSDAYCSLSRRLVVWLLHTILASRLLLFECRVQSRSDCWWQSIAVNAVEWSKLLSATCCISTFSLTCRLILLCTGGVAASEISWLCLYCHSINDIGRRALRDVSSCTPLGLLLSTVHASSINCWHSLSPVIHLPGQPEHIFSCTITDLLLIIGC